MSQSGVDIQIVPARAAHIRTIARRMRQADRDEVAAASGKTPAEALVFSLRRSSIARTALVDGRPEVMFGVGDLNILAGIGAPWLLGTDAVEDNFVAFLRGSVAWRDQLLQRYAVLRNFVDARNVASVRWLRWLRFELSDRIEWRGHEFHKFELRAADVRFNDGSDARVNTVGRGRRGAAGPGNGSVESLQRTSSGNECHACGSAG